jgi:23S rRNA-/tRNA-specific pseudouridylate synthase
LAHEAPEPPAGEWHWAIDRDPRDARRRVALPPQAGRGDAATSLYQLLASPPSAALLLLRPQTGRTHQLRVHASAAGVPLLGDRHYGGQTQRVLPDGRVLRAGRVMLHCARVRLPNFAARSGAELLTIDATVPDDFMELWQKLGGDPAALEPARW